MKSKNQKDESKNVQYSSIRVKETTKINVSKFLEKINKSDECGKITTDIFMNYLLEKITQEDVQNLQLKSTTWAHEDKRLRQLWEKKKGKVSENKWKEMLHLGQLREFTMEHTRLK